MKRPRAPESALWLPNSPSARSRQRRGGEVVADEVAELTSRTRSPGTSGMRVHEQGAVVPCPSGRRRFQRASKHVAERLGRPAAKALDVAGHNVKRTRREARLDADDDVDDLHRQTRLRQSGAQLLFRDGKERERPASDFGNKGSAFRTRQALGAGGVVDRDSMAVSD